MSSSAAAWNLVVAVLLLKSNRASLILKKSFNKRNIIQPPSVPTMQDVVCGNVNFICPTLVVSSPLLLFFFFLFIRRGCCFVASTWNIYIHTKAESWLKYLLNMKRKKNQQQRKRADCHNFTPLSSLRSIFLSVSIWTAFFSVACHAMMQKNAMSHLIDDGEGRVAHTFFYIFYFISYNAHRTLSAGLVSFIHASHHFCTCLLKFLRMSIKTNDTPSTITPLGASSSVRVFQCANFQLSTVVSPRFRS